MLWVKYCVEVEWWKLHMLANETALCSCGGIKVIKQARAMGTFCFIAKCRWYLNRNLSSRWAGSLALIIFLAERKQLHFVPRLLPSIRLYFWFRELYDSTSRRLDPDKQLGRGILLKPLSITFYKSNCNRERNFERNCRISVTFIDSTIYRKMWHCCNWLYTLFHER